MTSERSLQLTLLAASAAAFVIVAGLFSDPVRLGCLFVLIGSTVATSGARRERGAGWWWLLAVGTLASAIGAMVAQAASSTGGWIALAGGMLIPLAAALGYPRSS